MVTLDHAEQSALLRRFAPVVRYNRGEKFFPMDAGRYVRECSLWVLKADGETRCLIPKGHLDLEDLPQPPLQGQDATHFLKFIEPLTPAELATYRLQQGLVRKDPLTIFHSGSGRLARVGYGSRLVDALFSLTLFARGRLPGDAAAAAELVYHHLQTEAEQYCYYGRVLEKDGWTVLQYWFFYPFNDWRTGFFGVNDHEADWEMICIFLSRSAHGEFQPEWLAYAAHDAYGPDLRRSWQDPEIEKIGDHPVVYAGAGSHAAYFAPGEYLAEIEVPLLTPTARILFRFRLWLDRLIRSDHNVGAREPGVVPLFRLPFVDYARGDGISIGPGQDRDWELPQILEPLPAWASEYRGLWGQYTKDPFIGENAPAGPVYRRDGTLRQSWSDPVGWAGLDTVPPRPVALERVKKRKFEIKEQIESLEAELAEKRAWISKLGIDVLALKNRPHVKDQYFARLQAVDQLSAKVQSLQEQLEAEQVLQRALAHYEEQLQSGWRGDPRDHLRRPQTPASAREMRLNRIAEIWAAISIGLMTIGFVATLLFFRNYLVFALTALISTLIFLEAGFRRQLTRLLNSLAIGLALVSSMVLLFEFFWDVVALGAVGAGVYLIWENLRELWG